MEERKTERKNMEEPAHASVVQAPERPYLSIICGLRTEILRFIGEPLPRSDADPRRQAEGVARLAEQAARKLLSEQDTLITPIQRVHGFSRREARRAVRGALEPIVAMDLMAIWDREAGPKMARSAPENRPGLTVVFGGGTIPQPTVQALVAALMVSDRVLFRPSIRDPFLAPKLIETMRDLTRDSGPEAPGPKSETLAINERCLCASWSRKDDDLTRSVVESADSFVVFGEETTIDRIKAEMSPRATLHGYGPRISFAAIDFTTMTSVARIDRLIDAVAEDIVAYDQLGCLSAMALYLIGAAEDRALDVLDGLGRRLESLGREHGHTLHLPASAASGIHALRAIYQMDDGKRRGVRASAALPGWTLLFDRADGSLRPTPGYRTAFVHRLKSWDELLESVSAMSGRLQAMGLGPNPDACPPPVMTRLEEMGLSRVCSLGEMQRPPLDWTHDGNPFFPLAK